jgi:hypothetical protein
VFFTLRDRIGRPVTDGDLVHLADGRSGRVALALGMRDCVRLSAPATGMVLVVMPDGSSAFMDTDDLLVGRDEQ